MKLFRTGSVTVVTDCQIFYHFLPVTYQTDIRTVKFIEKFQSSDNCYATRPRRYRTTKFITTVALTSTSSGSLSK